MNAKRSKHQGFTLVECLVALLVLSGMLITFSLLIQAGKQLVHTMENNRKKEFEIFLLQLENEAANWEFVELKNNALNFLTIETDETKKPTAVKVLWRNGRVDKTPGTQPLLTEVQTFKAKQQDNTIEIEVVFIDQKTCKGKYILPRTTKTE